MEILGEIPVIEGDRVVVRRPTMADTDAVQEMARDSEVYRYLPGFLFELIYDEPVGASRYIESYQVEVLGIFLKDGSAPEIGADPGARRGRFVGLVEIYDYDREEGTASIGYRLCRSAWGRGLATESVKAVLDYLHTRADVRVVHAEVMVGNEGSTHVLEKCGFVSTYVPQFADWDRGEPVQVFTFTRRF